jgi:hypothetical protein
MMQLALLCGSLVCARFTLPAAALPAGCSRWAVIKVPTLLRLLLALLLLLLPASRHSPLVLLLLVLASHQVIAVADAAAAVNAVDANDTAAAAAAPHQVVILKAVDLCLCLGQRLGQRLQQQQRQGAEHGSVNCNNKYAGAQSIHERKVETVCRAGSLHKGD